MFHKLRLRLTLVNLVIIAALFAVLISGTYLFTSLETDKHSKDFLSKITTGIASGVFTDLPPHGHPPFLDGDTDPPAPGGAPPPPHEKNVPPHIFFARVTPQKTIAFTSTSSPLEQGQLARLTEKTLGLAKSTGNVDLEQKSYSYTRTSLQTGEELLVFEDTTPRKTMLQILLMGLALVGIVCLVLSYFSSYYLADRAMVPVQHAWQQQKEFLADASHELRTPLAAIQTNLEIVRNNQNESVAEQNTWLSNIHEEVKLMTNLVDSLLLLARADAHQLVSEKSRFPLHVAVKQALTPFEPLTAAKNIKLDIKTDPIIFFSDETKIKQIACILLENALRYTPPGGKIMVRLSRINNSVQLDVTDTGIGIAPEYLPKLFDRFYQVDPSRTKAEGGAGLGLAIAKCLADCVHGRLSVISTPGEGSTFSLYLPM